jgi:hypothetical protein
MYPSFSSKKHAANMAQVTKEGKSQPPAVVGFGREEQSI